MSTVFHNCVPETVHMVLVFFSLLPLSRTFKNYQNKGSTFFINTNLQIVLNTQKLSLLKSSHPKKILAKIFLPKKTWNRKFQTKKPFLQSSPSLVLHAGVFWELVFHPSAQTPAQPKTTFLSHCFI